MTDNSQLLELSIEHLEEIANLEREIFATSPWSLQAIRSELTGANRQYFGLFQGNQLIAYAGLAIQPLDYSADIHTLAVQERFRGRGLGTRLLLELIARARRAGAEQLMLEVRTANHAAIALYSSLGFEQVAIRPGYYQPENEDALIMRLGIRQPTVIGIETSCDETGIGIVRGNRLLANALNSSMEVHARYGGVVPEVAARAHLEALQPTLQQALQEAQIGIPEADAIAVAYGPGLAGALMVGVGAAKAMAVAAELPIYGVNHLVAHVGADVLERGQVELPTIALLVSGGHTALLLVRDLVSDVQLLGETIDDAAGEAFDKVARVLGLSYPGGPQIDKVALAGNPNAYRFPRGLSLPKDLERHEFDFSFSGLKTAVARHVELVTPGGELSPQFRSDTAASFREAVVDVLISKALRACDKYGVPRLLLGGGVTANARLREIATSRCAAAGVTLRIPRFSLCTDNGAMIAALGAQLLMADLPPSTLDFGAESTLEVSEIYSIPSESSKPTFG